MANKTISQLPAAASLASSAEIETQLTGGGASQKVTAAKVVLLVGTAITAFSNKFDCALGLTVGGGAIVLNANGSVEMASTSIFVSATGDLEIINSTNNLIIKSVGGNRFRLVVSDLGVLSTVAA